jgi:hypothetical protein
LDKIQKKQIALQTGCPYCNEKFSNEKMYRFSWQHILPKRRNGKDIIENMRPCCYGCNTDMELSLIDDCPGALACYRSMYNYNKGNLIHALVFMNINNVTGSSKKLLRKKKKQAKNVLF